MRRAVSEEDKTQRRDDILGAAKRVFAKKGYHATTVADVAKAAKVSYGSIYWYFDSKDALFHALMAGEEQALREHIAAALATERDDTVAGLRAAVRATFEFFEADRLSAKLLFRDSYALGERFEKHLFGIYERFIDDIEAVVADAQRRGALIDAPPRMIAFSIGALVGQIAQRRLTTDDGLDADVMADFVVSLLMHGLVPREPR